MTQEILDILNKVQHSYYSFIDLETILRASGKFPLISNIVFSRELRNALAELKSEGLIKSKSLNGKVVYYVLESENTIEQKVELKMSQNIETAQTGVSEVKAFMAKGKLYATREEAEIATLLSEAVLKEWCKFQGINGRSALFAMKYIASWELWKRNNKFEG